MERSGASPTQASSFQIKKINHWPTIILFAIGSLTLWLLEFTAQYYWLEPGDLSGGLARSYALAAATLIGLALFSSAIFKWFPRTARYWRFRRYLGFSGFIFVSLHVWTIYQSYFNFDLSRIYYTLNPFKNPLVFGSLAYPIIFLMGITSTDWAMSYLKPKRWKTLHRFIYPAYIASIFHFVLIDPELFRHLPGQILLIVTAATLFGQLYWFFNISSKHRFRSLGFFVGMIIIVATITIAWLAYIAYGQQLLPWQH